MKIKAINKIPIGDKPDAEKLQAEKDCSLVKNNLSSIV